MRDGLQHALFGEELLARVRRLTDIDVDVTWTDGTHPSLADIEVLLTGWGAPRLTTEMLDRMPSLRAVLHAGGTVRGFATPELWHRDIRVTSAAHANATPVAQFAASLIVLALKRALSEARDYATRGTAAAMPDEAEVSGVFESTVGIVGASRTGRATIAILQAYGCRILVADPTLDATEAAKLGVELLGLNELFARAEVVSIHAPDIPATRGMIGAVQLARLRDGSTLINTARPALIDQEALLAELRTGRLSAMLDVTDPEPLPIGHELLRLPNVFVTPHLAGAHGAELRLLGKAVLDELDRFTAGGDAIHPVRWEELNVLA
ncbi:hydroxyacid dehydrogenase [Microbacterium sp. PMB16]|uniref:hydroxyacid dehydrogenase n=1 Tax=Microbacterium sp. PMB16 TaxID=3120157 RepID=UPI003F4B37CF